MCVVRCTSTHLALEKEQPVNAPWADTLNSCKHSQQTLIPWYFPLKLHLIVKPSLSLTRTCFTPTILQNFSHRSGHLAQQDAVSANATAFSQSISVTSVSSSISWYLSSSAPCHIAIDNRSRTVTVPLAPKAVSTAIHSWTPLSLVILLMSLILETLIGLLATIPDSSLGSCVHCSAW